MRRIAVPVIGGMTSSTLLTLIIIHAIYALLKGFGLPRERAATHRTGETPSLVESRGTAAAEWRRLCQGNAR